MTTATAQASPNIASINLHWQNSIELTARFVLSLADLLFT
jgi:hypothetical protein